jgi:arginyl-tRNA synthetase
MQQDLEFKIATTVEELFGHKTEVDLTRPDEKFGDYATNVALQISKVLGKNPKETAEELGAKLRDKLVDKISDIQIAGPGFINLTLNDKTLKEALKIELSRSLEGKSIVVEYSDPNPFKVLHAGHLYTSVVGDAIANILQAAGANVHRVNFGGDVGLHVGKTLWAMLKDLGGENPENLNDIPEAKRSEWMAKNYVEGSKAYDEVESAKVAISNLNKQVYKIHADNDHDSPLAQIYWTCRQWSYDYFNQFYAQIGSHFEKFYPESETVKIGLQTVREHIADGVYRESDGAIIFDGDKYGLHTRVFINSEGLPTYEAKDVGLSMLKVQDFHFDKSIIITANEQEQYMAVVFKSIEQYAPELSNATTHLTHGIVKLKGGVKMSSRLGNFLRAVDVLEAANQAAKAINPESDNEQTVLGAVKYAFLKNRMGGDIIYDPEESVGVEGNSGPYLQYAHARAKSILRKAEGQIDSSDTEYDAAERSLARKIAEFPEVFDNAVTELMPHLIATYLFELAQTFNRFYEHNRVINDGRRAVRLYLVELYASRLKTGLELLGITAPEQM